LGVRVPPSALLFSQVIALSPEPAPATRHIAFSSAFRYDEGMADAVSRGGLQPGTGDEVRLEMRASDADRDRAAVVLGNAVAAGRLTTTEHAERLDAVYAATTVGQLAPLTRDLPADQAADAGIAAVDHADVTARFSKVIRAGRWVAGRRTRLTARFGALTVNLVDAVLPGREITLDIDAFCGKLIVIVPAGAQVIDQGGALFAKRAIYGREKPGGADGPVIRLVGDARFSKVAVYRGNYDLRDEQMPPWVRQLVASRSREGYDG